MHKASTVGLDVLTLPSHTSHRLQPLDVSVFRPFKCAFCAYRDAWTLQNRGRGAQKEDLAQWVDLALKRALNTLNIQKGFATTRIWPYNPRAMDKKMGPSRLFPAVHVVPEPERGVDQIAHASIPVDIEDSDDGNETEGEDNVQMTDAGTTAVP